MRSLQQAHSSHASSLTSSHDSANRPRTPTPVPVVQLTGPDGELMVIPKGVDLTKDLDSPLHGPAMADFDVKDIGETSARSMPPMDDVSAPSTLALALNSERIIAPMQPQSSRARRAESVSSAVSRDLERGQALPRPNHSPTPPGLSAGTNSDGNAQAQPSANHLEWNRASAAFERGRLPEPAGTNAHDEPLFVAFRESRWIRSVVIAKIGFVIMTLMVLGNFIYS